MEEKRGSLGKLIEDKTKWSRFWSEIDPNSRRLMSKEKSDSILKLAVKQFFVEKEVASTLVMDTYIADLTLLQRAVVEPLPTKDDKGSPNRTKDGGSGDDFSKESIERDERRLTEVGRRTIELFVLSHIFSAPSDGVHLIEADRVLKPRGYFVWTSPIAYTPLSSRSKDNLKRWDFFMGFVVTTR
ncbi:TNF receptor-associated factor homolog 1a-like protein [Tanacetum coccineum]|uniref:TNF receptor-associated factor homolog 1a-like protein n=1 Tax=Tanacetum coccineum TaxID=301880 RepID=A0ABQ5F5M4_9ASTR